LKKKKNEPETCSIPEKIQNKAGIDELHNSLEYLYDIEGKAATQELKRVTIQKLKKKSYRNLKKLITGN